MLKFLLVILIIFILFLVGSSMILRWARKIVNSFGTGRQTNSKMGNEKKDKDVLYNKDDIVVMKGDAGKKKN